jgi:hypothetical protein
MASTQSQMDEAIETPPVQSQTEEICRTAISQPNEVICKLFGAAPIHKCKACKQIGIIRPADGVIFCCRKKSQTPLCNECLGKLFKL